MNSSEIQVPKSNREPSGKKFSEIPKNRKVDSLVHIILSLSGIHRDDLEDCKDMPLAMDMEIRDDQLRNTTGHYSFGRMLLTACFEIVCCLLLGHRYPLDYVKPAVLVSAWGWSVFLGGVDASDPTDAALMTIRVIHGVPSRRGTRRPRIIDGPTSTSEIVSIRLDTPFHLVRHVPNSCTAKMRPPMVGFHSDAFQAVRVFDWRDEQGRLCEVKMGFRLMQELGLASLPLPACSHDNINNFKEWLSKSRDLATLEIKADAVDDTSVGPLWAHLAMNLTMLYGSLETGFEESTDCVFVAHKEHLATMEKAYTDCYYTACYYTTPNLAARWLQLCTLCQGDPKSWGHIFIRTDKTCYRCALELSRFEHPESEIRVKASILL